MAAFFSSGGLRHVSRGAGVAGGQRGVRKGAAGGAVTAPAAAAPAPTGPGAGLGPPIFSLEPLTTGASSNPRVLVGADGTALAAFGSFPLAGASVAFLRGKVKVGSATTAANGKATLKLKAKATTSYAASYAGTATASSFLTPAVTVKVKT